MSAASDEGNSLAPLPPGSGPRLAGLADLSPAYFGMVMATGIVSIAAHLLAMPGLANALFGLNVALYVVLWILSILRMIRYPKRYFSDMVDHLRGPGFFTGVAATGVLGSQCVLLAADFRVAAALWAVAVALWIALTYTIFAGLTVKKKKPTLDQGISGAWLLAVVATQSIADITLTAVSFTAADSWDTDSIHSTSTNPSRLTVPSGLGGK